MPTAAELRAAGREERIATRRARVAARIVAKHSPNRLSKVQVEPEEKGAGVVQLANSLHSLSVLKTNATNEVKLVRVAADDREYKRRAQDEAHEEAIKVRVGAEEEEAAKANAEIAKRWEEVSTFRVPQDLAAAIREQRKACDAVLASKDAVIEEIKAELKLRDEAFEEAVHQQRLDVDTLVAAMTRQVISLQEAYTRELENIENGFLQERQDMVDKNSEEMKVLISKRLTDESDFYTFMRNRADANKKTLDDLRNADMEEYNTMKVRLENDIAILEQHYEVMQAVYQTNSEKLDYNYRVLVERDKENYITTTQQKKKLTRQRDTLMMLKNKHAELERRFKEENSKLTEDYTRVTRLLQELQHKEFDLRDSYEKQHREFFCMHQHALAVLVSKVLQADKIVHEQQLGWRWVPPSDQIFADFASTSVLETELAENRPDKSSTTEDSTDEDLLEALTDKEYQPMLETLCDEAAFLVDEDAKKTLAKLEPNMHDHVRVVSILKALGVKSRNGLEKLRLFLTCSDEERAVRVIDKDEIVPGVKEFLMEEREPSTPPPVVVNKRWSEMLSEANAMTGERIIPPERLAWENFWKSFTTVISPKGLRVWAALEHSLLRYNELLKDRVKLTSHVLSLRSQNSDLRQALQFCLSSRAMQELRIPTIAHS